MPEAGHKEAHAHPHVNPWIIAIAVMLGTFMEVLDTTVVNVSLPHIAGSLSATIDEATWVITSYLVANAMILPITGWLANHFGRKRLLMMSVTGFTVASFFCGLAPTLPILIFFRIVQGAAGGALVPLSQAVLLESFPPEQRGKAMGFWGQGIVVAPIVGPVLGGWLTDSYSWRWVFYINIPVGIASIIMTSLFIFDPPYIRRTASRIDYWGMGMLAVGIGSLQVMLDKGQEQDWFSSRWITALLFAAAGFMIAFVVRELYAKDPVVQLRVFRDRTYSAGVLLMTVLGFVLYGSMVLLPIWLQTLLGYPAVQAGIALAPRGIGSFIGMTVIGRIMHLFDPRKLLAAGLLLGAGTLYRLSMMNLDAGYWEFFWPQFLQGVSLAMLFVPLTTITMSNISRESMGNATSMFNLLRNLGGGIGIAGVSTLVTRFSQKQINILGAHVTAYNPKARMMMSQLEAGLRGHGASAAVAAHQSSGMMFGMVERQATILSYISVFQILALIFLAMTPLVLLMKRPSHGTKPVAAH